MSYTQLIYHIVIRTKCSQPTIPNEQSEELYRYIWGIIKNKKSFLYRINGMPDHIHILVGLHATLSLSDFMKELKTSTNFWMKSSGKFPDFEAWGEKYAAFTCFYQGKEAVIEYIKNQREHHKTVDFKDEYRSLIKENGITIDEKYFFDD
ncbi:transposase [Bacteroidia bacterium]|nr:transposase [Bacteroidia bacterium]